MRVTPIKTDKITTDSGTLFEVLDGALPQLHDDSILVVTSKIVSICEGRIVAIGEADKEDLIARESARYLPPDTGNYGYHFTVVHNTLVAAAGIDESNGAGYYILWPEDPQKTCNAVRQYLREQCHLDRVGVVMVDSASQLLRRGAIGVPIAHSGFHAIHDYVGTPDIFGRPFKSEHSNIASGLAAAAVVTMGEGAEQTPLAVIDEVPFVAFKDADPTKEELDAFYLSLENDIFAPFLTAVNWHKGEAAK